MSGLCSTRELITSGFNYIRLASLQGDFGFCQPKYALARLRRETCARGRLHARCYYRRSTCSTRDLEPAVISESSLELSGISWDRREIRRERSKWRSSFGRWYYTLRWDKQVVFTICILSMYVKSPKLKKR